MITQKDDLGIIGVVVEDWDIEKAFKPKTITTDYSSWITYISRKAVPENTPITDTEYWKPITRLQDYLAFDYNEFKREIRKEFQDYKDNIDTKFNNLKLLVESFLKSTEFGIAFANEFGDNDYVGINQKIITNSINKLWEKIEDITGEILHGINMNVTPEYFISEDGTTVHIVASTVDANGIFEHIAFYANGVLISESSNVDYFEHDFHIDETTVVICKAKILGVEYTKQSVITHYNSFWIGAGDTYQDVMDVEHVIPITEGLRGSHNIDVPENKHIIIILGETFRNEFVRADISFSEILFNESTITKDGKNYSVLVSQDTYQAGEYNIFING